MTVLTDFHIHTIHSVRTLPYDSLSTIKEVVTQAKRAGLNCIAKTDHDTVKGNKEAISYGKKIGVVVVPGIEISKKYDIIEKRLGIKRRKEEHIIGLGINSKLPVGISEKGVEEIADWIHDNGGIVVAPHPFSFDGVSKKVSLKCIDVIEVHNGGVDKISNYRAKLAAKRLDKPGIAGSDAHWHKFVGSVINQVDADRKIDDILSKINKTKILKAENRSLNQIYEWQTERYKKVFNEASKYIIKNFGGWRKRILLYLLKSSVNENITTKIFWKSIMPIAYSYAVIRSSFGLLKDLTT